MQCFVLNGKRYCSVSHDVGAHAQLCLFTLHKDERGEAMLAESSTHGGRRPNEHGYIMSFV